MATINLIPHQQFTPAQKLLFACLRMPLEDAGSEPIRAACALVDDWDLFLALARHHHVLPLVANNLLSVTGVALPTDVAEQLQNIRTANSVRAMVLLSELLRLTSLLEAGGIKVLPLKGTGVALQLYGDIGIRGSGDIDLLVGPNGLEAAHELLLSDGYIEDEPRWPFGSVRQKLYMRGRHEKKYRKSDPGFLVELHWRLHSVDSLLTATEIGFPDKLSTLPIGDSASVPILPKEVQLLYLITHGARDRWRNLKSLSDLPLLMASKGVFEKARALSVRLGLERPFGQGILLAHELLGAPAPEEFLRAAMNDNVIRSVAVWPLQNLLIKDPAIDEKQFSIAYMLRNLSYSMALKRSLAYKRDALFEFYWRDSNDADTTTQGRLAYLYFMGRPFYWIIRRARSGIGKVFGANDHGVK